jgi:2-amino-4-hydroxy-6-hydroxymethyldihydropteridine diphosphokinase
MPVHFDAILGLGSNIGDKAANIAAAIAALDADPDIRVVARSRLFRTPPWGVTDQDSFANACVGVATSLAPRELLRRCQRIENDMGRVRERRWGPRVIDVDILVHGERTIDTPDLVVPHPRIAERAFVLAPLADIAPALSIAGKTVSQWLAGADRTGVEPWPSAK